MKIFKFEYTMKHEAEIEAESLEEAQEMFNKGDWEGDMGEMVDWTGLKEKRSR